MFKPRNKKEAEAVWEDFLNMSKKTGEGLLRFVFQDEHDFLMGDTNSGSVYRSFNLVECPEDAVNPNVQPSTDEEPPVKKIKKE